MDFSFYPLGDHGVIIELGNDINIETHEKVKVISSYIDKNKLPWMIEIIPAFTTVTIFYQSNSVVGRFDENVSPYQVVCRKLEEMIRNVKLAKASDTRTVSIPVCYGGHYGPDLEFVAAQHQLTKQEVIEIHSSGDYLVYMIGFAPGFPYIGGMSEKIATPRREKPRLRIPAGSVGIAGQQTGVYPLETPGGWQIIGRTPIQLFRPNDTVPSLLKAGDKIKFTPISLQEYEEWKVVEHD